MEFTKKEITVKKPKNVNLGRGFWLEFSSDIENTSDVVWDDYDDKEQRMTSQAFSDGMFEYDPDINVPDSVINNLEAQSDIIGKWDSYVKTQ